MSTTRTITLIAGGGAPGAATLTMNLHSDGINITGSGHQEQAVTPPHGRWTIPHITGTVAEIVFGGDVQSDYTLKGAAHPDGPNPVVVQFHGTFTVGKGVGKGSWTIGNEHFQGPVHQRP